MRYVGKYIAAAFSPTAFKDKTVMGVGDSASDSSQCAAQAPLDISSRGEEDVASRRRGEREEGDEEQPRMDTDKHG